MAQRHMEARVMDLIVPLIAFALGIFAILGFTIWSHPNE